MEDSSNNSMIDAGNWFENFTRNAKEANIQLKTGLINSTSPLILQEQKIDLIVVGTRGRTGFKKILLGRIASSIVTYAHCPVMVVK